MEEFKNLPEGVEGHGRAAARSRCCMALFEEAMSNGGLDRAVRMTV